MRTQAMRVILITSCAGMLGAQTVLSVSSQNPTNSQLSRRLLSKEDGELEPQAAGDKVVSRRANQGNAIPLFNEGISRRAASRPHRSNPPSARAASAGFESDGFDSGLLGREDSFDLESGETGLFHLENIPIIIWMVLVALFLAYARRGMIEI